MESLTDREFRAEQLASTDMRSTCAPGISRRVLVLSKLFPSSVRPSAGVFVKERVRYVAQLPGYEVRVFSPVPRVPPFGFPGAWSDYARYPDEAVVDGLFTRYPRYYDLPKLGQYVHTRFIYRAVVRALERSRHAFDFDLIDAHFAYPSGVVAVMLGRRYGKPVVITCRGSDILRYPKLPLIGRKVRWALREATRLIAVSSEIAREMQALGADPAKISVIPNGVDCEKFRPIPQRQAREALGLPVDRPIVLSVGALRKLKGMDLLADAAALIRRQHPKAMFVIVGGPAPHCDDYSAVIKGRIETHRLENHVRLAGARPHTELPLWYSAADVFALLSSQEGSPNVLMEALACGVPAVGTPVGGIPDVLSHPGLGVVLGERSAAAVATGIAEALECSWERDAIRRFADSRGWGTTARKVSRVFEEALAGYCG